MTTIETLLRAVRREAARAEFPIDRPVYEKAGKDPLEPVLFAGSLDAPIAILGRDLGKDEVALGQPLIGAGGRLVREGLLKSRGDLPAKAEDPRLESALKLALLTNTVPYKPPGNKAYNERVKERFRPFMAELLVTLWTGSRILTLGTEAFAWFSRYAPPGESEAFWSREDRYEADFPCEIAVDVDGTRRSKTVTVGPLPHPSPLNQRWYGRFPGLLAARLARDS